MVIKDLPCSQRPSRGLPRRQEILLASAAIFYYRDVFARAPQNLKSQLLVFHDGSLFIEYRFTYL